MKTITPSMIMHWVGSDHDNKAELLILLTELVNGSYSIEEFKEDILDLWTIDDEVTT
jgi:hypothetical protein